MAIAVAVLGYYDLTFTLAQALKRDPRRAYAVASYDGRNGARLAAALSSPDADPADRRKADDLARTALRQDPVNVAAASALGINAAARGDEATARRAFGYAERLSRRDIVTQLWAIEDAVKRGDIKGALQHYDIALRVKPAAGGVLFPVLMAASGEQPIRAELVRTLAARPSWGEPLVNFAAASGVEPQVTATLFNDLHRAGVAIPEAAKASLLGVLLSKGYVDQAWAYYASLRPGASRDRSRDPRLSGRIGTATQFDWVPISANGVVGSLEDGAFDFSAPASVGGPMLQQVQLLRRGRYRLTGHSAEIDQPEDALPYWVLVCRNGRELGRVDVPRSSRSHGDFTGLFDVGADCPVQTLVLVAKPSDSISGLSGRIDRVELAPSN